MDLEENKRKILTWWDILVLTILMLGSAIYTSTIAFLGLPADSILENAVGYSATEDIYIICSELVILVLVLLYLKLRRFDFSRWKIRFTPMAALRGIILYMVTALGMDLFMIAANGLSEKPVLISYGMGLGEYLLSVNALTLLVSMINGTFEELYFLGICTAVSEKWEKQAFLFALFIRISFHTYQGIFSALGIGLVMGIVYYAAYERDKGKNLFPFFLAHMIADIIGLGLMGFLV
ncbi:MAG: type II CAAX prenyl endopeptidase Rce1 family protein [Lachnospiraceae bacterium]